MKYSSKLSLLSIFILGGFFVACSSTSQTSSNASSSSSSVYPGWYNAGRSVSSSDSTYMAYATALSADSSEAAGKAVRQARARLKSGIANKLESIRTDAVIELGSDSGLDDPRFILALRKAENAVSTVSEVDHTEVEANEGQRGYRGFVRLAVEKEALIERIGSRLSGYESAWNNMKESEAFSSF